MRTVSFVIGAALLLLGCAHVPLGEHMSMPGHEIDGWKILTYHNSRDGSGSVFYVPPGELHYWTRGVLIGYQKSPMSVNQFVETGVKYVSSQCPGTTHQLIESDTYNVYYINTYPACKDADPQSEITRMIQGNEGIGRLSYMVQGRELTPSEKEQWLAILRKSHLRNGDQHEIVR